jgi:hypothetical protein
MVKFEEISVYVILGNSDGWPVAASSLMTLSRKEFKVYDDEVDSVLAARL